MKLNDTTNGGDHHQTKIILENVTKSSPFYLYEIDNFVKQLRTGETLNGWLYLALLHANTTSVLPDPFLGKTGTEMALELLQSANCWTVKPLNDDTISLLNSIEQLSPIRQFYPKDLQVMQTIDWPQSLPSFACHEAYQWIVEKLILESKQIDFAFGKG